MILLQRRGNKIIQHRRLRQLLVFRAQRRGDVPGQSSCLNSRPVGRPGTPAARSPEIHQPVKASFSDGAQLCHGNGQQIAGHLPLFAVRMRLETTATAQRSPDQRIISTGVEFDIYLRLRVAKLIAAGAMHLRHRAKA